MTDFASSLTRTIARDYDLFQASLEFLQKERKFLNYGYTVSGKETYEERQERLCLEVFEAAEIGQGNAVIDVGFGSGEQDPRASAQAGRRADGKNRRARNAATDALVFRSPP